MIQLTPQMRILVAVQAADFRKGIDGLCRMCRDVLQADPFSGFVFVFRNRSGTSVKLLMYDGQGFWLCQKRLFQGRFRWWPEDVGGIPGRLAVPELQLLLWNGNPMSAQVAPMWKKY
jgi:transposase